MQVSGLRVELYGWMTEFYFMTANIGTVWKKSLFNAGDI